MLSRLFFKKLNIDNVSKYNLLIKHVGAEMKNTGKEKKLSPNDFLFEYKLNIQKLIEKLLTDKLCVIERTT